MVFCGTGPSLWDIDPTQLRATEKLIFGINNSFELLDLDFWMAFDSPDEFDSKIWKTSSTKFYNFNHLDESLKHNPHNIFFYKSIGPDAEGRWPTSDMSLHGPFINFLFEGTFAMSLQMLNWLGFKRGFLIGCDFGGESKLSRLSDVYPGDKRQAKTLNISLDVLKKAHEKSGIEFISCTPNSPINDFLPYKPIGTI